MLRATLRRYFLCITISLAAIACASAHAQVAKNNLTRAEILLETA